MRLLKSRRQMLPVRKDTGSINRSNALQFFIPCTGLSNGNLIESKRNCVIQPQTGYAFEYNSTLKAVRSTALGSAPVMPLISGSFPELPVGKKALFMVAGYLSFVAGNTTKTIRCALGDINNALGQGTRGWGQSDSASAGSVAHCEIGFSPGIANGSFYDDGVHQTGPQDSLGLTIENALGVGAYFYRYVIYDPAVLIAESAAMNPTTGVAILSNNLEGGTTDAGTGTFVPAFRTHGIFLTGVGLWYFDTIPPDKDIAMLTMANYWKDGDRVVWPWA